LRQDHRIGSLSRWQEKVRPEDEAIIHLDWHVEIDAHSILNEDLRSPEIVACRFVHRFLVPLISRVADALLRALSGGAGLRDRCAP
jgi:hypothetical protein